MANFIINPHVIGRQFEIAKMRNFLKNNESELFAIIGRRRVGKTFLVKKVYEKEMIFHITGIKDATKKEQLENFVEARNTCYPKSKNNETPKTLIKAFAQLKELLGKPTKNKRVIFLTNCHG